MTKEARAMDNVTKDLIADMIESGQGAITGRARSWLNSQVAQALATALAEREGERAEIARLRGAGNAMRDRLLAFVGATWDVTDCGPDVDAIKAWEAL